MARTTGRGRRSGAGRRPARTRPAAPPREAASTVAVVADEAGFAQMRRYPTFRFADHHSYLRHMEALLRSLARRDGYTSVALFDPAAFADWCQEQRLDPDSPSARARYAGEIAARGATVPYDGRPLHRLVPALLAEHERWETWERGTALLAAAGDCPRCGAAAARCAFQRATSVLTALLRRAEPGVHHLVCSLGGDGADGPDGRPLTASLSAELGGDGEVRVAEPEALVLCTVLAAGLATGRPAGLVLRSAADAAAPQRVRGWSVHQGRPRALTEAEVFAAYCTDARTGEPVPPEPGVSYTAAFTLPSARCDGG